MHVIKKNTLVGIVGKMNALKIKIVFKVIIKEIHGVKKNKIMLKIDISLF